MLETLSDLLKEQLKDLYNAEKQLTKALPKMAKKASSPALREAFTMHLDETQGHIERLEQIAERLGFKPSGKVCKAMQGLIEEGKEVLEEEGADPILDAALIAAAQRVEHYEIAAYGTVRAIAQQLGETEVMKLLEQTLENEKDTDVKLTELSVNELLPAGMQGQSEEQDGEQDEEQEEEPTKKKAGKKVAARR